MTTYSETQASITCQRQKNPRKSHRFLSITRPMVYLYGLFGLLILNPPSFSQQGGHAHPITRFILTTMATQR